MLPLHQSIPDRFLPVLTGLLIHNPAIIIPTHPSRRFRIFSQHWQQIPTCTCEEDCTEPAEEDQTQQRDDHSSCIHTGIVSHGRSGPPVEAILSHRSAGPIIHGHEPSEFFSFRLMMKTLELKINDFWLHDPRRSRSGEQGSLNMSSHRAAGCTDSKACSWDASAELIDASLLCNCLGASSILTSFGVSRVSEKRCKV